MTDDETAAAETLEQLAKGREKTAADVDPDAASPGAQFEARRLEEEADYLRMGAAAIRVKEMLVEALEGYRTTHDIGRLVAHQGRACDCDDCARAEVALAEARKPTTPDLKARVAVLHKQIAEDVRNERARQRDPKRHTCTSALVEGRCYLCGAVPEAHVR